MYVTQIVKSASTNRDIYDVRREKRIVPKGQEYPAIELMKIDCKYDHCTLMFTDRQWGMRSAARDSILGNPVLRYDLA